MINYIVSTLKIIMIYILIILLSFNLCTLFAQRENEFQDMSEMINENTI